MSSPAAGEPVVRGFVLGKFMPPHAGHAFLCRAATQLCDELTILVCSLDGDPIPGSVRFDWMKQLFPEARVLHYGEDIAQEPGDHPEFWALWRDLINSVHPEPVAKVFGSDPSVHQLAAELGATCVILDPDREAMPVPATAVRQGPQGNWELLPPVVRLYFARRVCVTGPESTGKSTLTRDLARHYDTLYMPEYGRIYDEHYRPADWTPAHLVTIAQTHQAMRRALLPEANRVLVEDTDALLTEVWCDALAGEIDPWFNGEIELADLYLLTDIDVPWVSDGLRLFGKDEERRAFFEKAKAVLDRRGANYIVLSGTWDERKAKAIAAVDALLEERE